MVDLVKILYLLFLLVFLYYFVIRVFIMRDPFGKKEWVATLIVLGFAMVFYVRFVIHDLIIMGPSDEALYASLAREVSGGLDPPVSGPGFVYLILLMNSLSGWPVEDIMAVLGIVLGSAFPLFLYFVYREAGIPREITVFSCLIILSTSYFLWPMIESRPQQFGILLLLVGALLYHSYLNNKRFLGLVILVVSFTFLFHILTFLVLISMVIMLWWLRYIEKRTELKEAIWPGILFGTGLLVFFSPLPLYSSMNGGVKWMFEVSKLGFVKNGSVLLVLLAITVPVVVGLTIFLRKKRIIKRLRNLDRKHLNKIIPFFVIAVVLVLLVQFFLNRDVHSSKYRESFQLFLLFQLGNIVFGGLFVKAFFSYIRNDDLDDPFFRFVFILMVIGFASLLISIFLPMNFNNWAVRMINYWTVFAVPMIARDVTNFSPRWRKLLAIVMPVLISLSLINISRDQTIFGYP